MNFLIGPPHLALLYYCILKHPQLPSPDNPYTAISIVFKHVYNIRSPATINKGVESKEVLFRPWTLKKVYTRVVSFHFCLVSFIPFIYH